MKALRNIDCTGKHVLIRADFNVESHNFDDPNEIFRLTLTKETIDYILSFPNSRITLITHYGRPEGKQNKKFSTRFLVEPLERIYDQKISFTRSCIGSDSFEENRIALRENLRFFLEEEANDSSFAQKIASGCDLYVNEAFSVCHRSHASVVAITKFLPSVAGFHLEKEIRALSEAINHPDKPAVAVLGGAKIETKLPLIEHLALQYDAVLLGGKIANEAIDRKLKLSPHVYLPIDFRDENRFDIGEKTVENYAEIIQGAKTILWNGPLGKFEEPPYDTGTFTLLKIMSEVDAYFIAGGGESLAAIQKAHVNQNIDVISSGGGAMLDFLSGKKLPGLLPLMESR